MRSDCAPRAWRSSTSNCATISSTSASRRLRISSSTACSAIGSSLANARRRSSPSPRGRRPASGRTAARLRRRRASRRTCAGRAGCRGDLPGFLRELEDRRRVAPRERFVRHQFCSPLEVRDRRLDQCRALRRRQRAPAPRARACERLLDELDAQPVAGGVARALELALGVVHDPVGLALRFVERLGASRAVASPTRSRIVRAASRRPSRSRSAAALTSARMCSRRDSASASSAFFAA